LRTYPLSPGAAADWQSFAIFEVAYAVHFVAVEFFFRGYLLLGLQRTLGALAVPVSVVPYALLHVTKPFPEALASIVAGMVLGILPRGALSVVGEIIAHEGVAVTMDLGALPKKGALFYPACASAVTVDDRGRRAYRGCAKEHPWNRLSFP